MQSVQPNPLTILNECITTVEQLYEHETSRHGNFEALRPGIDACERMLYELRRTHINSPELSSFEARINLLHQKMEEQSARIQKAKESAFVNLFSCLIAVGGILLGYYSNPRKG